VSVRRKRDIFRRTPSSTFVNLTAPARVDSARGRF
jgi:hypothetical protein